MAARPSLYNEERNQQRIRERERRNQEVQSEKELYPENTPLFGEPYKTNKGDELSSRIQRMLGNYEDVRELVGSEFQLNVFNPSKGLQTPALCNPSGSMGKTQPPPNPQCRVSQAETPSRSASKPHKTLSALEYSQLTSSCSSLSQVPRQSSPDPFLSGGWLGLQECATLPAALPALSPPAEPLSPLHSSGTSDSESQDPDEKDSPPANPVTVRQCRYASCKEESNLETQKDIPSQLNEAASLPTQTFPPPLPSKPNLVMPQKPTAYVRPMDGQDQVPFESPDLKHSPEGFHRQSYDNLPDLKTNTKAGFPKLKISPHSEETTSDVHCVEDILREMTHTWPPPLTAIHTPNMPEPPKFPLPKESQIVNCGISGQKDQYESAKVLCHQGSLGTKGSVLLTHSSGGESSNSTDSESTSGSESDSDSSESDKEELPHLKRNTPSVSKDDSSVANKWQLDNWLVKVNQQNSAAESLAGQSQRFSPVISKQQEEDNYQNDCISQATTVHSEYMKNDGKVVQETLACEPSPQKSSVQAENQRKTVGTKRPSKANKAPCSEVVHAQLRAEVPRRDKSKAHTDGRKIKKKSIPEKSQPTTDGKKADKHSSKKKVKQSIPKAILKPEGKMEVKADRPPSLEQTLPVRSNGPSLGKVQKDRKKSESRHPLGEGEQALLRRDSQDSLCSLIVKIELSLLSRLPRPGTYPVPNSPSEPANTPVPKKKKQKTKKREADGIPCKESKKRPAEKHEEVIPRKKHKLDEVVKLLSSGHASNSAKVPKSAEQEKKKKVKKGKPSLVEAAPQDLKEEPKGKRGSGGLGNAGVPQESSQPPAKHKKKKEKNVDAEQNKHSKKVTENSLSCPVTAQPTRTPPPRRPLLKFQDRQYPVEYHMKEAKKLKHKADATMDKVGKAFNYLDAAMSFVESAIAMETDPQTPKSAYTMFSETVDLIRFILKLRSCLDPAGPASERDFTVLCLRCQSLLQMAMFRHKRDTALKYSRTLTEHFKGSSKFAKAPSPCVSKSMGTPSMSPTPSPGSSGNFSSPGSIAIPPVVQQVAASYVNITAHFLNAHDTWEQAEALAKRGSGLLEDLDAALGPLTLTSSMSLLVHHTRQGLHWLRLSTS
ncbi:AF4/FMR2 family member 1 isoform X1 [Brienomyrus brachyistius]|uniref:AF4/FMR2 family member 1 isoform X1 n=1 Tax=Brienomyrus brachyistius TaxID=42636 RepID=UPI0020B41BA8|nr:AF4/FMR2 family member 1 isoform X1 [Brienomyrus brachyistius]